jgi:hypothetical protein
LNQPLTSLDVFDFGEVLPAGALPVNLVDGIRDE